MNRVMVRCRILLVEDEPGDALFLRRAIQKHREGCVFACVKTGSQAIDYLCGIGAWSHRANSPLPHLIFLDLSLPGIDGFDLLAWLRAHPTLQSVPVVAVTGSAREQDHLRAMQLGALGCLRKPVPANELVPFLEKLLPPDPQMKLPLGPMEKTPRQLPVSGADANVTSAARV